MLEGAKYQGNWGYCGSQNVLLNSWLESTLNITWSWLYVAAPIVNLKPSFSNYKLSLGVLERGIPRGPT